MAYHNPRGNLGRAMTILHEQEVREDIMHEDVSAFGAPSECHRLVERGHAQRMRQAWRHACAVSGLKRRELMMTFNAIPAHAHRRTYEQLHRRMSPFGYSRS